MIRWITIVVLAVVVTVLGYREIERCVGDSNVTLTDIREAVQELREGQETHRATLNGHTALIANNNTGMQQMYGRQMDLHRRTTALENLAPAHPPAEQ